MSPAATTALESALTLGLLAAGLLIGRRLARDPVRGPRLREAFRRPMARGALVLLGLYALLAALDSVAWTSRAAAGASLEARQPRSLLDRAFAFCARTPEHLFRERSYVAPFAAAEFTDASIPARYRHPLGTTQTGHDTLYKVLKGCKPAIVIGTLPLLVAIPLALVFGCAAGWYGKRVDDAVVYVYTTVASVPHLLLLIAIVSALGRGLPQLAAGLGVLGWVGLCRLVRAETLKLREADFVHAATTLGHGPLSVMRRHILPNLLHLVLISAVLSFTGLVLTESILSYLGLGLDNSWGAMVNHARHELSRDPVIWWNITSASVAVFLLVLSVNLVGDALRDAFDPRAPEAS